MDSKRLFLVIPPIQDNWIVILLYWIIIITLSIIYIRTGKIFKAKFTPANTLCGKRINFGFY